MDDPLDRTQSQHIHRRGFTRRGALAVPAVLVLSSLIASQYYNGPLTHLRVDYSAPIAVGVHEPGLPQQPIDWRDEDAELRNYTWTSPAPDPSLARLLGNLSDVRQHRFEERKRAQILFSTGGKADERLAFRDAGTVNGRCRSRTRTYRTAGELETRTGGTRAQPVAYATRGTGRRCIWLACKVRTSLAASIADMPADN